MRCWWRAKEKPQHQPWVPMSRTKTNNGYRSENNDQQQILVLRTTINSRYQCWEPSMIDTNAQNHQWPVSMLRTINDRYQWEDHQWQVPIPRTINDRYQSLESSIIGISTENHQQQVPMLITINDRNQCWKPPMTGINADTLAAKTHGVFKVKL